MGMYIASYECHITTTVAAAKNAESIAAQMGWKTSEIKRDPLLGDDSHFYLTAHDKDYDTLYRKMRDTADALLAGGDPVLRQKIEGIIFDTKTRLYGGKEHKHVDDLGLESFAEVMAGRLREKRSRGYGGWDDPARCQIRPDLMNRIYSNTAALNASQPHDSQALLAADVCVDIANLCMMTYHRLMNGFHNRQRVTFCQKCDKPGYACTCPNDFAERNGGRRKNTEG